MWKHAAAERFRTVRSSTTQIPGSGLAKPCTPGTRQRRQAGKSAIGYVFPESTAGLIFIIPFHKRVCAHSSRRKLALFFQIAILIDYLRFPIVYCLLTIRYAVYAISIARRLALIGFGSPESGTASIAITLSL
jgi:hypothetical protein